MYKNYNLGESVDLGYEEDMLEQFSDYGSGYICDIIMEIADSNVSIYCGELWEMAPELRFYIEDAINEFGLSGDIDLIKIFQMGQYYYNEEILYENLGTMIFNYAIEYLEMNHSNIFSLMTDNVGEYLEKLLISIDNNNYISDIDEILEDNLDDIILEILEESMVNNELSLHVMNKEVIKLIGGTSLFEYNLKEFEYEKDKYTFSYMDKYNIYFTMIDEKDNYSDSIVKITEIELI